MRSREEEEEKVEEAEGCCWTAVRRRSRRGRLFPRARDSVRRSIYIGSGGTIYIVTRAKTSSIGGPARNRMSPAGGRPDRAQDDSDSTDRPTVLSAFATISCYRELLRGFLPFWTSPKRWLLRLSR